MTTNKPSRGAHARNVGSASSPGGRHPTRQPRKPCGDPERQGHAGPADRVRAPGAGGARAARRASGGPAGAIGSEGPLPPEDGRGRRHIAEGVGGDHRGQGQQRAPPPHAPNRGGPDHPARGRLRSSQRGDPPSGGRHQPSRSKQQVTTSKNATAEPGRNEDPLAALGGQVGQAIEFAEIYPEPYRARAFDLAFQRLNDGAPGTISASAVPVETAGTPIVTGGLAVVAREIEVDPRVLARVVSIGEENRLSILGRIDGRTKAELQVAYSVVYCYIKERALNQLDTPIAELRELCQLHACHDTRSEEHTSELQSRGHLVCRLLLEKKKHTNTQPLHTQQKNNNKQNI